MPKTTQKKVSLSTRLKQLKPQVRYREASFKMKHEDFGELELDLHLAEENLIVVAMRNLLKTKSFRCSMFGGAVVAELSEMSRLRITSIRRLRNKA